MALIVPILIAIALIQVLIGVGIFVQSSRSKQASQRIFVVLLAVMLLWTLVTTILIYVDSHATVTNIKYFNIANSVSFFLSACTLTLIYFFGLRYPTPRRIDSFRKGILASGLGLALISPFSIVSGLFTISDSGLRYHYGKLTFLFAVYALVVLLLLLADAVKMYRSSVDERLKRQATTIMLGLGLSMAHALVFILVLPTVFGNKPIFFGIGYLAPYYYTGFTIYSLLRQGLFDIRTVIVRAIGYVVSLALLVGAAGAAASLISVSLFGSNISLRQAILFASISAVVAALYNPLRQVFNKITYRFFYRDAYDPQILIDNLNKLLFSTIKLDEMLAKVASLITSTLKVDNCVFSLHVHNRKHITIGAVRDSSVLEESTLSRLFTKKEQYVLVEELSNSNAQFRSLLLKHGINLIVPMARVKYGAFIGGYLVLGQKKNGSPYNRKDINTLIIVVSVLSIAIQNALRFQEVQGFNRTLQEKVDDATKMLRQKNERLRVLDQTKDDFISMASHQLRTPLTSVKGYISMVLDGDAGKISPLQRKLLTQSFLSSQRMVYLISDLLNVSRLRTGKFVIEPVQSNLADVVAEEVEQLKETAKGRDLELTYKKPEHFPVLMLDENKLRQVIMNFIDNAIYYTPAKGHITVTLVDSPESVEFTVKDSGLGVPKHEQHHLFSKFYRAHNAKRARPDGTGLGLFMAKKVIIAQGGAVIFKSQEGKGSTFGFTFPKQKLLKEASKSAVGVKTTGK